jgi:hypothetical protein
MPHATGTQALEKGGDGEVWWWSASVLPQMRSDARDARCKDGGWPRLTGVSTLSKLDRIKLEYL